ncbi:dTDP-4-dehydrorhamnose 3,5-epimerase [Agrobacterium tumefaciens]|nr:dTDP-4-dehydrorhamnose 3,5-epimerase [Agrobacterium tumefaciens]WHO24835.1 dTDP-4-dehydrorhamnose 3,5-epimerase [Agrobacterium tumefaciens]
MRIVQVEAFSIPGLKKITPARFGDSRGYFNEVFKKDWFRENVLDVEFVQDNESLSAQAGTVRGLHFQTEPFAQGKLVRCIRGRLLDVAVDIRTGSPTFGQWAAVELSPENGEQLWVPVGFAHGFMTLVDDTVISYKVTKPYSAANDRGIKWNDPAIGINWPKLEGYVLSEKDGKQPLLSELPEYFTYQNTGN